MDLRQLEYVVALADLQVLSRASERVHVTVSALSQSIARLEEVGTPLFLRTKKGWVLTHAGSIYVDAARDILRRQKRVMGEIADIADGHRGILRIGFSPGRAVGLFKDAFPRFSATYPNIQLQLREAHASRLEEEVAKGLLDMVFTSTFKGRHAALEYEILGHEEFVLAIPRTPGYQRYLDAIAAREGGPTRPVGIDMFRDEGFVLMNTDTSMRVVTDAMFAKAQFTPKLFFESNTRGTLYSLIENGYGISIIPAQSPPALHNVALFRTDPPGGWDIAVAYLAGSYLSSAQKYFIDLARRYYTMHDAV